MVRLESGALKSATALPEPRSSHRPDPPPGLDTSVRPSNEPKKHFEHRQTIDRISIKSRGSSSSASGARKESVVIENPTGTRSAVASVFLKEGGGPVLWLFLGVALLGYGNMMLARSWWIHIWTDNYQEPTRPIDGPDSYDAVASSRHPVSYYVGIYLALSALACVFGTCRTYFFMSAALRASQQLFRKMLHAVLQAPLQWHDAVPLGNILSRFSADLNVLDVRVGDDLRATLEYTMDVAMAVIAGAIVNPFLLVISGLLFAAYVWCARRFLTGSRELKTLENAAKGPLLEHMDSILSGLSTVRAFGQVDLATQQFRDKVDRRARAFWHLWLLNRWLGFRVNIIGAVFSALSAAMVAYLPNVTPSMAGFAISFTMEVSLTVALSIRRFANLEQGLNSMARIHSYTTVPPENDDGSQFLPFHLPGSWPRQGKLEVSQLVVRHAPHLPLVLRDVTFTIAPGTRVGVVGRTGAGKSSLVLALFRFIEASQGAIFVDGVNISHVPLHQLRSRLAIIPQHPILFRGSVRSNLDSFDEYDDATFLAALQAVGWQQDEEQEAVIPVGIDGPVSASSLATANEFAQTERGEIDAEENGLLADTDMLRHNPLDLPIADCGENLSQGQQQLLCLARVIIRQPKIMILDEATSAVDKPTDDLIQRSLGLALGQCEATVLVVAHRLKSIADSDMVLVMDNGQIVESGIPRELLQRENGHFRGMVEQDSEREMLKDLIMGEI